MRVLLYTGTGGAGTTTVVAATGLRCAALGRRTLVLDADAAPSLAHAFAARLGPEPAAVADDLWAQQVDAHQEITTRWGALAGWLQELVGSQGRNSTTADLAVLPGMHELACLLAVLAHAESGAYDVVVVDGGATAAALRLLSLPDVIPAWVDRSLPPEPVIIRLARPLLARLAGAPASDETAQAAARDLFARLKRVGVLLTDPHISSARLVLTPERVAISRSQHAFTALNLYGYPVDLVVCNRVIPDRVHDPYFAMWRTAQDEHMEEIAAAFAPVPVRRVLLLEREPVGIGPLRRLGEELYGESDPAAVLFRGHTPAVTPEGDAFVLALPLPLVRQDELALTQSGDELTVRAGVLRRTIVLPRALQGRTCRQAHFDGRTLRLRFERT